jgi:hypothetical protein
MDDRPVEGDGPLEAEPLYDHTLPRHPRLGLALLGSLIVLGGGQLVRGELKRAVILWGVAILGTGEVFVDLGGLHAHADTYRLLHGAWGLVYAVVKTYGIFDTMRPDKRLSQPLTDSASAPAPAP